MSNYQEKDLENFIESYLLENHAYIKRTNENYDKNLCLDVELFENFLQATQSVALEELKKRCGQNYKKELFDRIFSQIKTKGIVKALRLCRDQRHQNLPSLCQAKYQCKRRKREKIRAKQPFYHTPASL